MPCKLFFKKSNIGYINIRLNRFKSKKKKIRSERDII